MSPRFFWIQPMRPEQAQAELNRSVASHSVIATDRYFVPDGANSAWAISVNYTDGTANSKQFGAANAKLAKLAQGKP